VAPWYRDDHKPLSKGMVYLRLASARRYFRFVAEKNCRKAIGVTNMADTVERDPYLYSAWDRHKS
jgi:hypothetical protein